MSATNDENANGRASPMTPLRTLDSSIVHQFASPRWSSTLDEQHRARALASGLPFDIPHTIVNPALAQQHFPSPQPKRLLPSAWRNGPQSQSQSQPPPPPPPAPQRPSASRPPLQLHAPAPPAAAAPPPPSQRVPAPPVLVLHRRAEPTPSVPAPAPTRARLRQGAGQSNHDQAHSPPSPPIPPSIRPSARVAASSSAAGKGSASRPLYRSAPALAAAAEPLAPETPHRDWDEDLEDVEDDDDDEQQATIRPPKHHARPPPAAAASRRTLVSIATAMTPYQHQPAPQNDPDIHRAPTPILDTDHADNNNSGRMTRSRARQLQQQSLGSAVLPYMQPVLDAFTTCTTTTISAVLSLLSFCLTRPIRWLSNQTNPLFTFSFLFILVLLLLSWALEPPADPTSLPTPPQPTPPELNTLVDQLAEMEHATMQLVYQQDALEAADAAHHVEVREEVSASVALVVSERVEQAVDASVARAVDEVVTSVLEHVHQLTLGVAEMAGEVANMTLRMDQPDASTPTAAPALDTDTSNADQDAPDTPAAANPPAPLLNYASFASGARALPGSSSPTHVFPMHPRAVIGGWLPARAIPWFLRPGVPAHGHNWALHADMQRGSCWATPLGAGGRAPAKLTVRLARPVRPAAVAVWHHERGGAEAPRDVRVYGRRVRDGEWYLVARGEYVRGERERQVIEVRAGVDEEVDQVRFVVERNWGANEYTCLYRVEVLAPAPAPEPEAAVEGGVEGEERVEEKVSGKASEVVEESEVGAGMGGKGE